MGYYADYNGSINFKSKPTKEVIDQLDYCFVNFEYDDDGCDFGGNDKYYSDTIQETLEKVKPYVGNGEIEYAGEDNTFWRFIFVNGEWAQQNGRIVYDS